MRYGKVFVCLCTATGYFATSGMPGPAQATSNSESFIYYGFTQSDLVGGDSIALADGIGPVPATTAALRQAYGAWSPSSGAQTSSLFLNGEPFSNVTEFWNPIAFTFLRNPQARVTPWHTKNSQLSIALEEPNDGFAPARLRALDSEFAAAPQELLPDITAELSTRASWGRFEVGGIARDLGFEKLSAWDTDRPKGNWAGWGVDVSGALNVFDKDQLTAGIVYGRGIANYMNDGGVDLAAGGTPTDPHAVAMPLYGISAFYDHSWTKEWSSSIGYSFTKVDNAPLQAANAYRMGQYASINLLYSPDGNLAIGGEALWGQRIDRTHMAGEDLRLQFSLKYSFETKAED